MTFNPFYHKIILVKGKDLGGKSSEYRRIFTEQVRRRDTDYSLFWGINDEEDFITLTTDIKVQPHEHINLYNRHFYTKDWIGSIHEIYYKVSGLLDETVFPCAEVVNEAVIQMYVNKVYNEELNNWDGTLPFDIPSSDLKRAVNERLDIPVHVYYDGECRTGYVRTDRKITFYPIDRSSLVSEIGEMFNHLSFLDNGYLIVDAISEEMAEAVRNFTSTTEFIIVTDKLQEKNVKENSLYHIFHNHIGQKVDLTASRLGQIFIFICVKVIDF